MLPGVNIVSCWQNQGHASTVRLNLLILLPVLGWGGVNREEKESLLCSYFSCVMSNRSTVSFLMGPSHRFLSVSSCTRVVPSHCLVPCTPSLPTVRALDSKLMGYSLLQSGMSGCSGGDVVIDGQ